MSYEDQGSCTPEASKHLTDKISEQRDTICMLVSAVASFNDAANIAQRRQMELESEIAKLTKRNENQARLMKANPTAVIQGLKEFMAETTRDENTQLRWDVRKNARRIRELEAQLPPKHPRPL